MTDIRRQRLLSGARETRGLAVVIDVFRAFSTAAYAVDRGATVMLVGSVEDAFALRRRWPKRSSWARSAAAALLPS